jgi:hypothetical protein
MSEVIQQQEVIKPKLSFYERHKAEPKYIEGNRANALRGYYYKLFKHNPDMYTKSIRRLEIVDPIKASLFHNWIIKQMGFSD